jgi:hypothetical protein
VLHWITFEGEQAIDGLAGSAGECDAWTVAGEAGRDQRTRIWAIRGE